MNSNRNRKWNSFFEAITSLLTENQFTKYLVNGKNKIRAFLLPSRMSIKDNSEVIIKKATNNRYYIVDSVTGKQKLIDRYKKEDGE